MNHSAMMKNIRENENNRSSLRDSSSRVFSFVNSITAKQVESNERRTHGDKTYQHRQRLAPRIPSIECRSMSPGSLLLKLSAVLFSVYSLSVHTNVETASQ